MPPMLWNSHYIRQCERRVGQAMLRDEHMLALFSKDFGQLMQSKPSAVCIPPTIESLQNLIHYAASNKLPVTIRGNGMSQNGQSLAVSGGLVVSMEDINKQQTFLEDDSIWVEANTTWATLLQTSLKHSRIPFVIPYNCDLSIAGVISVGGIGASSFKYGSASTHVSALEVITADADIQHIDSSSPLFHACLGGQGRFGIITKACIQLRTCLKNVRTFFLVYLDKEACWNELQQFKKTADYIELFCSPSIQGAKLSPTGRLFFAEWLFAMHVSVEYDVLAPELTDLNYQARPWKILHTQDESILSYCHRHDLRLNAMKLTGQWELAHPWYECFVPLVWLQTIFDELLNSLPLHFANALHIVSVAPITPGSFLMLPDGQDIVSVMILNPGVPKALVPSCLDSIQFMDARFLSQGGKRYLSGFLGHHLSSDYWKDHFGNSYEQWKVLKQQYDPYQIFCSFRYHENDEL